MTPPKKGLFIYHSLSPKSSLLFFRGKYGGQYAAFSPLEGKVKVSFIPSLSPAASSVELKGLLMCPVGVGEGIRALSPENWSGYL